MDRRERIAAAQRAIQFLTETGMTRSDIAKAIGRPDLRPVINGQSVMRLPGIRRLQALCADRAHVLFAAMSYTLTTLNADEAEEAATKLVRYSVAPALHRLVENMAKAVERDNDAALFAASMRDAARRLGIDPDQRELFQVVNDPAEEAKLDRAFGVVARCRRR